MDTPPAYESVSAVEHKEDHENSSSSVVVSAPLGVAQPPEGINDIYHTVESPNARGPGSGAQQLEGQEQGKLNPSKSTNNLEHEKTQTNRTPSIGQVDVQRDGLATNARMAGALPLGCSTCIANFSPDDGRVNITIGQTSRLFSQLLHKPPTNQSETTIRPWLSSDLPPPRLNVVIQVVGSRGDVQPFVALGKTLKEQHQHRVRLATHATFKDFVEGNSLEFFNIGGDPAELMAFMVKNPGLMPGMESLRHGDVGKRQREIWEILLGCWRSCIETGDGMDENRDDEQLRPFVADAIIANPPSFAHIHCAEKLGVPVHLMFTMPWSPTEVFSHPLANIQASNSDPSLTNLMSYTLVEALTWQGLGHVINRFRTQNLRLEAISLIYAPTLLDRLHIPYTYCWSPTLIPKPHDWGQHITIPGFYFLNLASTFTPDPDLSQFLEEGPPPIYIGFGSIVVDDPNAMTTMIFDAIRKAGVRALVSKGWGGLGKGDIDLPDTVFMLGNIPHDWLFQRVSCVVHHGGAGTTAAGISLGTPTVIVPFFGDQPFWGAMIARAGAGPVPVPYKKLTAEILAKSILEALEPSVKEQAAKLASSIAQERGTEEGAKSFHRELHVDNLRCSLAPNRVAVWRVRRTQVRLSALAVTVLMNEGQLKLERLKLYRPQEHDTRSEPPSPLSGVAIALLGAIGDLVVDVTSLPVASVKSVKTVGAAKKEGDRSSTFSSSLRQHSKTQTATLTHASTTSTLVPSKTDGGNSLLTTQSSLPAKPSQDTLRPDSELQTTETTSAEPLSLVPDGESSMLGAPRRSLDSRLSTSTTCHPPSDGSTLNPASTRAPIGSQKREVGPGEIVGHFVGGVLRSPMDLTLTLARGFNNAPKLYGDKTVRKPDKINDLQSGIKMAGKVRSCSILILVEDTKLMSTLLGTGLWLLRRHLRDHHAAC